jgi:hypothetical protein
LPDPFSFSFFALILSSTTSASRQEAEATYRRHLTAVFSTEAYQFSDIVNLILQFLGLSLS